MCVFASMHICDYVNVVHRARRVASDPTELELQVVLSHPAGVLTTEWGPLQRLSHLSSH